RAVPCRGGRACRNSRHAPMDGSNCRIRRSRLHVDREPDITAAARAFVTERVHPVTAISGLTLARYWPDVPVCVMVEPERRITNRLVSILESAAGEHLFAHIRVFDVFSLLQPACLDHRTVRLVICAFAGFIVGEVFDKRRAEWLERLARGLQVFRLSQCLSLLGDLRRE